MSISFQTTKPIDGSYVMSVLQVTDRLELLNSEACTFALPKHHAMGIKLKDKAKAHALFDIHSEQCRVLDCSPSDGCGYIDEDFLVKTLFGNNAVRVSSNNAKPWAQFSSKS